MRNFYHTCKFSTLIINFPEVKPRQILDLGKQFNLMIGLENVLKTSLEDVLKMFWRRSPKTSWKRLGKTFWRRMAKTKILVFIKTSWRRLEDVFGRRMIMATIFVLIKKMKTKDIFKASSRRRHRDECLLRNILSSPGFSCIKGTLMQIWKSPHIFNFI